MKLTRNVFVLLAVLCVTPPLFAVEKGQDCGQNAALRYWMAFALLENPAADSAVATRLERVAEGDELWDESLTPILERNAAALAIMHRGSRIGFCHWGFEHEMLADAPIANLPRARALTRLNVLHGIRLSRQGRNAEAVDAWLAGVRFSRDVAADGPWLSALVAGKGLKVHFEALTRAAREGKLDASLKQKVQREVAALGESGFDWSVAASRESEEISAITLAIEGTSDPVATLNDYKLAVERRTPEERARFLGLSVAQVSDREAVRGVLRRVRALNDDLRPALVAAFRMPHERSVEAIRDLDARAGKDPTLSAMWPSKRRANDARGEVVKARTDLLALVR